MTWRRSNCHKIDWPVSSEPCRVFNPSKIFEISSRAWIWTIQPFRVRQLTVIQQFKIEWGEPFAGILLSLEVGRAMLTWTHWHAHIMNPLFHTRSNPFSWCFTLPGITPALGSSCSVDQIQNMGYFRNRLGYYLFSFHKFPAPVVFSFEYPRIRLLAPAELVLFVS
jgi:hypothetical protein